MTDKNSDQALAACGRSGKDAKTTVLLADDDETVLRALEIALGGDDMRIVSARSGTAALEAAIEVLPELLVLDVNMPGLSGYEVCAALRRNFLTRHIPILMLTRRATESDELYGLNSGADEYVPKPFNLHILKARIAAMLRRSRESLGRSPLTELPGSGAIQREVEARLARQSSFSFSYVDIRNFKAVNDAHGFHVGNGVILALAAALCAAAASESSGFVGHIGGDDFVLMTVAAPDAARLGSAFQATAYPLLGESASPKLALAVGQVNCGGRAFRDFKSVAIAASRAKEESKLK